jgi:hypothetical protein
MDPDHLLIFLRNPQGDRQVNMHLSIAKYYERSLIFMLSCDMEKTSLMGINYKSTTWLIDLVMV